MAGLMLADLGATVVKVEPPRGDPYRRFGKPYGDSSLLFKAANTNKTSVAIDLKSDEGRAALFELLTDADVLITNWRPSVAPKMGLTPERVRTDFPQLIWCRISGYGQDGPRSGLPAYDGIVQARSGSAISGTDAPLNTNNNVADKVSAMFAAQTITAALHQRERTGTGSICDMAMVDAMAYFYGADISAGHRVVGAEIDTDVAVQVLSDSNFATAQGYLTLAPVSGRQLRRAMESAARTVRPAAVGVRQSALQANGQVRSVRGDMHASRRTMASLWSVERTLASFERSLRPADKLASDLGRVLNKRISVKIGPIKPKGFTIRQVLEGPQKIAKKLLRPLEKLANKALQPIMKKIKVRLPVPKALTQFSNKLNRLPANLTPLSRSIDRISPSFDNGLTQRADRFTQLVKQRIR